MKMKISETLFSLLVLFLGITLISASEEDKERKLYIVYMGDLPKVEKTPLGEIHHSLLSAVIGDKKIARESLRYSYTRSFNAIAAMLMPEEVKRLLELEVVITVFPNTIRHLHTTRSWDFMGFPTTARRNIQGETEVIVGMLDTGIWPYSPSFKDHGFGPPPTKWKGNCLRAGNFTGCNNKIVGARYYRLHSTPPISDIESPMDVDGHGTHTSSTVTGAPVNDASVYGLANGTARGGVPSARIAAYKVCWTGDGCSDADLLAAFDDAIADGVDIISISIGGGVSSYFEDPIAIGSFHAMKHGILTVCSGGNDGPTPGSITNVAPWVLTVAASGIDRQFMTKIKLGNGQSLVGSSINTFSPKKRIYPLISGEDAANASSSLYGIPSACDYGTLDEKKVMGKIVYCLDGMGGQDQTVKDAGGSGALIVNDMLLDTAFPFLVPAAYVTSSLGSVIDTYINSTGNPQAVIYKSRIVNNTKAPFVASFSSRGPNLASDKILKPDITAPGIDILAAYSRLTTMSGSLEDDRIVDFNIISGTSMAAPHASATAAYVKSFRPDWSPAAIKSAIITTAKKMSPMKNLDSEFAYGGGHLNPVKAVHPGLVYDIDEKDYVRFLCKEGYNGTLLALVMAGNKANCSNFPSPPGHDGLNYPTMQYQVQTGVDNIAAVFYRTVTNVGTPKIEYKARVIAPVGFSVTVTPDTLSFSQLKEKKSFQVMIKGPPLGNTMKLSAEIMWIGPAHSVRSPIIVFQQSE